MVRQAMADKVLVLGIDGLDPRLTDKYLKAGKMPNIQKFLEKGASHTRMEMVGGQPTVTPPMWTTMATGANPCTHGITDYYAKGEDLDVAVYNFDSTRCRAEQMWNVAAEAGRKTLVWHWPGSSWPPTSDSPNLTVVDGTQPGGPNVGIAEVEGEKLIVASVDTPEVLFRTKAASDSHVPCFISGMEVEDNDIQTGYDKVHAAEVRGIALTKEDTINTLSATPMDVVFSPIKDAHGWADAPEGAKEFTMLYSKGLIRRPGLLLKNAAGVYDTVKLYRSKKDTEPVAVLPNNVFVEDVIDEAMKGEEKILTNRNMRVLEIAPDGSRLRIWISAAMDFTNDTLWHPKTLLKEIVDNVGYPQPVSMAGGSDERLIADCTRANWDRALKFNAGAIKYLIANKGYEVVYSHFHNVDLQGHLLVAYLKNGGALPPETYQRLFAEVYYQADRYVGEFLPLLDEGWTILLVSDHGQVCPEHDRSVLLSGVNAVNAVKMREWGYTVMKKDADGKDLYEIDWSKTTAVAQRINHIYINLKGRDPHGIVDPADQFELEERIMTDLYSLRDEKTGHRVCHLALRNRDAVLLGEGGPEGGDIIYFVAEGYNDDHADSLSTINGSCDTSVRSVFMAAGKGIKTGFRTERVIHHIDVTPTVAALTGLRMPAQCEGAPVYQIFEQDF